MGIQWKRVSCVYIPSILYSGKRQGALEKWIDSATFLCTELAMVFFGARATTLHTCPKKFGNLQLYILVECKDKVLLKISAI